MTYDIRIDHGRDALKGPFALAKLTSGYLQPGERLQDLYRRVANHFCDNAEHAQFMYDAMSQHWFSPATPVLANGGIPGKGLPISCYLTHVPDTRQGLMDHFTETAMLSSLGGGLGAYYGDIRPVGSPISRGGKATGVIPYLKVEESVINAFPQSGTRRGSVAGYLPVWHVEIEEFVAIRKAVGGGDQDRRCTSVGFHHGVVIPDAFMFAVRADGEWDLVDHKADKVVKTVKARSLWQSILEARAGSGGEPYLLFIDTVNRAIPEFHKQAGLEVHTSNLCCVTGDQRVVTQKGLLTARELYEEGTENIVPGMQGELCRASPMHLIAREQPVFEIQTSMGYSHRVTAEHRVWVVDRGWVEAQHLRPGDKLQVQDKVGVFGAYAGFDDMHEDAFSEALAQHFVPEFVWRGTWATVQCYLEQVFQIADHAIDFCTGVTTASLRSKSLQYLQGLQVLLANCGVPACLYTELDDAAGDGSEIHTLELSPGCFNPMVTAVVPAGVEDVYCLEVASDTHAWVCNGLITHNSEITLPTNPDRTAVCCLGSLNLETYEQWKDTPLVEYAVRFLDNVLQDFIDTAPPELHRAAFSAMRERSIGLGVMGWHSFLQSKMIPFESAMAVSWNKRIWKSLNGQAKAATRMLAVEKGPCPDAADYGVQVRNANLFAIAPTASISSICGPTSPSIEPWSGNVFTAKTNAGNHTLRNTYLEALLESKGQNTPEVWDSIQEHLEELPDGRIVPVMGSVQHLDCLSDYEKAVFASAFEIDPLWIIQHAADRQPYVCQAQSVNLFMDARTSRAKLNQAHYKAWELGVKSLYYCRLQHNLQAENLNSDGKVYKAPVTEPHNSFSEDGCLACQ